MESYKTVQPYDDSVAMLFPRSPLSAIIDKVSSFSRGFDQFRFDTLPPPPLRPHPPLSPPSAPESTSTLCCRHATAGVLGEGGGGDADWLDTHRSPHLLHQEPHQQRLAAPLQMRALPHAGVANGELCTAAADDRQAGRQAGGQQAGRQGPFPQLGTVLRQALS